MLFKRDFILDPSLVLYLPLWKLDGASLMSRDAYGHLCTVTTATWTPHGYDFNSATPDYIELPASATQLNFTSEDFSLVIRFQVNVVAAYRILLCRGEENVDGWRLMVENGKKVRFSTYQAAAEQRTLTSEAIDTNLAWYTVGVTRVGADVYPYVNGVLDRATIAVHVDPLTSARTAKIGIADNKTTYGHNGKMEFLAVWNRALNPMEQQNIHLAIKSRRI